MQALGGGLNGLIRLICWEAHSAPQTSSFAGKEEKGKRKRNDKVTKRGQRKVGVARSQQKFIKSGLYTIITNNLYMYCVWCCDHAMGLIIATVHSVYFTDNDS